MTVDQRIAEEAGARAGLRGELAFLDANLPPGISTVSTDDILDNANSVWFFGCELLPLLHRSGFRHPGIQRILLDQRFTK